MKALYLGIMTNSKGFTSAFRSNVEEYKQRRCEALQALAWRITEQVKAGGEPFTLEPMPAYERRIIHLTLAEHPDVTTQSIGEGEARKVVILPKGQ